MPPENIRRISVFGLGHRFLSGTRNSHFSRPVTLRENAGLLTVTIRFDSHKLMPDFSGPHRGASSTPRCVFIPSSASCRSSVPVYSRSTAPTLLKPFSKHSSKAGKTKKEGVCARRDTTSPRSLGSIFSRPPGLSFSLASRSQPATSPRPLVLPASRISLL